MDAVWERFRSRTIPGQSEQQLRAQRTGNFLRTPPVPCLHIGGGVLIDSVSVHFLLEQLNQLKSNKDNNNNNLLPQTFSFGDVSFAQDLNPKLLAELFLAVRRKDSIPQKHLLRIVIHPDMQNRNQPPTATIESYLPVFQSLEHVTPHGWIDSLFVNRTYLVAKEMGQRCGKLSTQVGVTQLKFSSCSLDATFLHGLASVSVPPSSLWFNNCGMSDDLLDALTRSNDWKANSLQSLRLCTSSRTTTRPATSNSISPNSLRSLAKLLCFNQASLRVLDLSGNDQLFDMGHVGDEEWIQFRNSLSQLEVLEELNLRQCRFDRGCLATKLISVNAPHPGRGLCAMKKLNLGLTALFARCIRDDDDDDGEKTVRDFVRWLAATMPNLQFLDISRCRLTNKLLVPLFQALEELNSSIQHLKLDLGSFHDCTLVCGWERSLRGLSNLTVLDMRPITVTDQTWPSLEWALCQNVSLVEFPITWSTFQGCAGAGSLQSHRINQLLCRNRGIARARQALCEMVAQEDHCHRLWSQILRHVMMTSVVTPPPAIRAALSARNDNHNFNVTALFLLLRGICGFAFADINWSV